MCLITEFPLAMGRLEYSQMKPAVSILELGERHTKSQAHRAKGGNEVVRNSRELSFGLEVFSVCSLCPAKDSIRTEVLGDYWKEHTIPMED